MDRWHRFPEILGLAHWIVLERKPTGHETIQEILKHWISSNLITSHSRCDSRTWKITNSNQMLLVTKTNAPDISSIQIREAVTRTGEPPEGALLPEVLQYLKENHLYVK